MTGPEAKRNERRLDEAAKQLRGVVLAGLLGLNSVLSPTPPLQQESPPVPTEVPPSTPAPNISEKPSDYAYRLAKLSNQELKGVIEQYYDIGENTDAKKIIGPQEGYFFTLPLPRTEVGKPTAEKPTAVAVFFEDNEGNLQPFVLPQEITVNKISFEPRPNPKNKESCLFTTNGVSVEITKDEIEEVGPDIDSLALLVAKKIKDLINEGRVHIIGDSTKEQQPEEHGILSIIDITPSGKKSDNPTFERWKNNRGELVVAVGGTILVLDPDKIPDFLKEATDLTGKIQPRLIPTENPDTPLKIEINNEEGELVASFYLGNNNNLVKIEGIKTTKTFAKITASALNVREGPRTNHSKIGSLPQGTIVKVSEEVVNNNGETWVKINYQKGEKEGQKEAYIARGKQFSEIFKQDETPSVNIDNLNQEKLLVPSPNFEKGEIKKSIADFVNAMKMAGIKVDSDTLLKNTHFEIIKRNGEDIVVMSIEVNEKNLPKELKGRYPLLIYDEKKGAFRRFFWVDLSSIPISAFFNTAEDVNALKTNENVYRNFNFATVPFSWGYDLEINKLGDLNFRMGGVATRGYPIWGGGIDIEYILERAKNREEVLNMARLQMEFIKRRIRPKIFMPLGEIHKGTPTYMFVRKFGKEIMPEIYRLAQDVFGEDTVLVYNETYNYSKGLPYWYDTKKVVDYIKSRGINVAAGMQMHINQYPEHNERLPRKEEISEAIDGLGVPVYITEFDVNNKGITSAEQARRAYHVICGCLASQNCRGISFWATLDSRENWGPIKQAPFDKSGNPKLFYYAISKAIFDLSKKAK